MSGVQTLDLAALETAPLPQLAQESDKEARGRVLVVGGGAQVPGAAVLTGVAALRAGAGKLQLCATPALAASLGLAVLEAAIIRVPADADGEIGAGAEHELFDVVQGADTVVIGPGMMREDIAGPLAAQLMTASDHATFVIDAAAMTGLPPPSAWRQAAGRLVITPHAGEMARLSGLSKDKVRDDPLAVARATAREMGAVVVMKGATTFVVTPEGKAWRHDGGVSGLGTSGSGDVLAGVIGGFMARGAAPAIAAMWGVWVHAQAGVRLSGRIGPLGFLARELLAEVPSVLALSANTPD